MARKQTGTATQAPAPEQAPAPVADAPAPEQAPAPAPVADDDDTRTLAELQALTLADDDTDGYRSAIVRARIIVKRYNSAWNNAKYATVAEEGRFKGLSVKMQADPKERAKSEKILAGLQADYDDARAMWDQARATRDALKGRAPADALKGATSDRAPSSVKAVVEPHGHRINRVLTHMVRVQDPDLSESLIDSLIAYLEGLKAGDTLYAPAGISDEDVTILRVRARLLTMSDEDKALFGTIVPDAPTRVQARALPVWGTLPEEMAEEDRPSMDAPVTEVTLPAPAPVKAQKAPKARKAQQGSAPAPAPEEGAGASDGADALPKVA